jgi:hypothetical protein
MLTHKPFYTLAAYMPPIFIPQFFPYPRTPIPSEVGIKYIRNEIQKLPVFLLV